MNLSDDAVSKDAVELVDLPFGLQGAMKRVVADDRRHVKEDIVDVGGYIKRLIKRGAT